MGATLPIPAFYGPKNAGHWDYAPDQLKLAENGYQWKREHNIKPSGSDKFNFHLLLIDAQKDFCFPKGTLYVSGRSGTGAIDDSNRTAKFIYRNLKYITDITTTFDTHFAYQIFFPWFWLDENDQPLSPHTMIKVENECLVNIDPAGNVLHKRVKPNPAVAWWLCDRNYTWLVKQVMFYNTELAKAGKYTLYLWPPHCLLGSDGHALVGVIHEARMFHSLTRGSQSWGEVKGGHPLTENYSVLRPEVLMRWDSLPLTQKNTRFLKTLLREDTVVIAGQADSHCVKSSIDDLLNEIVATDPDLAKKVYIMTDCMSSVVVPDGKGGIAADFTPQAEDAHKRFADAGMNIVKSTDPVESWPGIKL